MGKAVVALTLDTNGTAVRERSLPSGHSWRWPSPDDQANCMHTGCHRYGASARQCADCGLVLCSEHRPSHLTHYRGLRGIIIHVKAAVLARDSRWAEYPRDALGRPPKSVGKGICKWCHLPLLDGAKRKRGNQWDLECIKWYMACRGHLQNVTWGTYPEDHDWKDRYVVRPGFCPDCGMEWLYHPPSVKGERPAQPWLSWAVDHRVSLGVAVRLGPRAYLRAVCVPNLRWICGYCHTAKTASDRADMSVLDRRAKGLLPKPKPHPQPALFET